MIWCYSLVCQVSMVALRAQKMYLKYVWASSEQHIVNIARYSRMLMQTKEFGFRKYSSFSLSTVKLN